jgi:phage terminase large subunit GpA-like protein
MNRPLADEAQQDDLTAEQVQRNGLPRYVVPLWATRLTAFVDVQGALLYYLVAAWRDDFTGAVIDYGTFPDQRRPYFSLHDARPALADVTGVAGLEPQLYAGLTMLARDLLGRSWEGEHGARFRIERLCVDANWQTDVVKQWVRQCGHQCVTAAHGRYFGAAAKPITEWQRKPGERRGHHWVLGQHLIFDTNVHKQFVRARLLTPQPAAGSLVLYGDAGTDHRLLIEHLLSEYREKVEARGRAVDEFKLIPGRENHWWDCLVGAAVAASVQGCALPDVQVAPRPKVKQQSYRELWEAAQERKRGRQW